MAVTVSFLALQVVGGDPALAVVQAVQHLAVPPAVGVLLQHLQVGTLGEPHGLLVAAVLCDRHVDLPQRVVDELRLLDGLGSDGGHRDAVSLDADA